MKTWSRASILMLVVLVLFSMLWLMEQNHAIASLSDVGKAAGLETETVILRIRPKNQMVELGKQFTIAVEIANLANQLSGFQFDLSYDPSLINPVGISSGAFLSSTGRMILCAEPVYPNEATIRLACVGTGGGSGPTGNGILVSITFAALNLGTSPLNLSALQLAGGGIPPVHITATTQGGVVNIVERLPGVYLPVVVRTHWGR